MFYQILLYIFAVTKVVLTPKNNDNYGKEKC